MMPSGITSKRIVRTCFKPCKYGSNARAKRARSTRNWKSGGMSCFVLRNRGSRRAAVVAPRAEPRRTRLVRCLEVDDMYLYESPEFPESPGLRGGGFAGPFGQSGSLRHFSPSELVLSPDNALAVLRFFWPDMDLSGLGGVTDSDRDFAQGLLLEAVDASCTMEITESIFTKFYLKV